MPDGWDRNDPEGNRSIDPPGSPTDPDLEQLGRLVGLDATDPSVRHILQTIRVSAISARGVLPLPPPQMMAEYRDVIPDLPERIVYWTETQAEHRRSLERARADGAEARMNRGQWGALIVALVGIAASAIVGMFGNAFVASILAVVSVGGPTAAVVLASNSSLGGARGAAKNKDGRSPEGPKTP